MARITIHLFPHAGGDKYAYDILKKYFPDSFNVYTHELPGRGARIGEPLLKRIDDVIEDMYRLIEKQLEPPYVLYGHGLGSVIVNLLVRKIRAEGHALPQHLFLSGRIGPY